MKHFLAVLLASILLTGPARSQYLDSTYAERLGYPKGARVIILHVDDVGMSFDSNEGAIAAMTRGIATSCSVMMPCPWVPAYIHYLRQHPQTDAGLHLTLTSEWKEYRWGPLSGKSQVPGLVDGEGDLWPDVASVVQHASADEVETEIRAQIARARDMGFVPTHMDSHMGTLFASPAFLQRYVKLAIEYHIPVMFPAGHATLIARQHILPADQLPGLRQMGRLLWNAGLPVLDDIFNESYDWKIPADVAGSPAKLAAFKTAKYIEALRTLKPGITYVIMHCTMPTEVFSHITDSGPTRRGDMLAMESPELEKFIQDQGIILTTWRELSERRSRLH
ncbi:MAG TPA: polysaccharide deacetylase family protein [Chitinophagaceae bacterium]|nr:polysaccharide deacetylase family protein [Chitinophagaceae bacterium]